MREDWIECILDELISKDGLFCDGDWIEKKDQDPDGSVRLIQLADIGDGVFRDKSNRHLTAKRADELNCSFLKQGDILIARMPEPLGRAAIFPLEGDSKFITAVDVAIVRPDNDFIYPSYLLYNINSQQIRKEIESLQSGTTRKRISRKNLNKIKFPFAPLPIQRAIVTKIENLFASLDKGIADLKKAQEQLNIYRQAVLKKAFEGELTKEWRAIQTNLPTADELLEQIQDIISELEKTKEKRKEKQLATIKDEDIPHNIPLNWVWCNLGDVSWFINGDRSKNYPNRSEYVSSGIPWINTGHIQPDGSLSAKKMHFITREKYATLRSGKIQAGDLVYCLRGATFGKTAYVTPYKEGSIASSLMIIRSTDKLNVKYLFRYLTSAEGKLQLERFDNGSAQPNLSANMVRSYAFPLPPLEEQKLIIKEIESRLSVCDKVEQNISEALEKSEALRQSILKKAFEGKLLSETEIAQCKQEADYEPANVLLERIKSKP